MQSLNVTLESITPIFIGGADPRGEPELRAASFRGALRFWLRALLGATARGRELHELQQAELEVFGSTEKASPIILRVKGKIEAVKFSDLLSQGREKQEWSGVRYLFFVARATKKGEQERCAINTGQQINLQIRLRPGRRNDEAMRGAYAALWLLCHFGGVGARWRRGAGGLQATWPEENIFRDLPPLIISSSTPHELKREIEDAMKKFYDLYSVSKSYIPPDFENLHPENCEIVIIDRTFPSWQEALNLFGQAMRDFRKRRPPEYQTIKKILRGGEETSDKPKVLRAAFGLPIVFYYSSLREERHPHYQGVVKGAQHDRRASPLIVRVIRLKSEEPQFALLMIRIKSSLLPRSEDLVLEYGEENRRQMSLPAHSEIEETMSLFFKHLHEKIGQIIKVEL